MNVLLSAPYLNEDIAAYRPLFESANLELVVAPVRERLEADELLKFAGKVDGVICGDDRFNAAVLGEFSPRLKVISKWGTGIDSIDLEAAAKLGISVLNTPDAFTEAVSDSVLGYVLCFARGLPWLDHAMKKGNWEKASGWALHERTLGVIGVGRIGRRVLVKARGFGMHLLGNDIIDIEPDFLSRFQIQMVKLEELLAQSDFVSINCDLNPTSRGLLGKDQLALMKGGAVLINTARGPVVVEDDLIDALQSGQVGGAALDVFEKEPLPNESPLRDLGNVMLAPHNANASYSARERVHWNTICNLFMGLGLESPQFGPGEAGSRSRDHK